jgi:hypothetical protein
VNGGYVEAPLEVLTGSVVPLADMATYPKLSFKND